MPNTDKVKSTVKIDRERGLRRRSVAEFFSTAYFLLLALVVAFPFVAMIIASFRPGRELIRYGLSINLHPDGMTVANYDYLLNGTHDFWLWFRNSIILTLMTVILTLLVCYFVAYGIAMYDFKGKNLIFLLIIATMMVPFEILMLPLYQMVINLNLVDTRAGVMLPGLVSAATIFFYRQYMRGLPRELLDSGRIDGANEYDIAVRIMMPICKPAIAAQAIMVSMSAWNNMLWPLLVFRDAKKFTLPIGLNTLMTPYGNNYDLLIAGSVASVVPVFIVFLAFQKYFIEGLTAGSVKG